MPPGGNFSATLTCATCANKTTSVLTNLTFGDVWVCSGQSNMQLGVQNTIDRNQTKQTIRSGGFRNIRLFQFPQVTALDGEQDFVPTTIGGPWTAVDALDTSEGPYPPGSDVPWVLDSFSAHCFHTFQELTTILGPNQTIPFGLVESAWGVSRDHSRDCRLPLSLMVLSS